jgi:preprotein translocase subunit SecD
MSKTLLYRFALIAGLVLLAAGLVWRRGINLGLDLQGGTYLALELDRSQLRGELPPDAADQIVQIIRTRVDELGVAEPSVRKVGTDRVVVELPGIRDEQRAKEVILKTAFLEFKLVAQPDNVDALLRRLDRAVLEALGPQAAHAGPTSPTGPTPAGGLFRPRGTDTAASRDTARADTALAARPFSAKLTPVDEGVWSVAAEDTAIINRYLSLPQVQAAVPRGLEFRWAFVPRAASAQARRERLLYLLESRPILTGQYLEDAQAQRDPQLGQPEVVFRLNRRGGRLFGEATGRSVGRKLAIVLDGRVYSAPVIQDRIERNGRITLGGASMEEARDLALVLRAGALPAPIRIVEERTIGPSLGQDAIRQGWRAGLIGVALVVLLMVGYYKFSGVLAVVALGLYVILVLGSLAFLGATLTLPGLAGLVLSIGMAVDANVLIFERIREELALGRSLRAAIDGGFKNALSAIVDSNVTTLIAAAVLYQFGTGPVRGFAVTLALGVVASMFTAIFVTRTLFLFYLSRRPTAQTLSI